MRWREVLMVICLVGLWCKANAQELPFTHYTPDREVNALPSAMVTQVYQDRQGFIWLSVFSSGLVRFDGARMDLYDARDGLEDLGVWQVAEDGRGYLWVTTNAGLMVSEEPLSAYAGGRRIAFTSELHGTPLFGDALNINRLAVDASGGVWIATMDRGMIRYAIDDEQRVTTDTLSTRSGGQQNAAGRSSTHPDVQETTADTSSAHRNAPENNPDTLSTHLNGPENTATRPSTRPGGQNNTAVHAILALDDGRLLAALEGGHLVRFRADQAERVFEPDISSGDLTVISLYEDPSGSIWAYRQNGEILLFDDLDQSPEIVFRGTPSSLASVTSVGERSVWATNGTSGIARFDRQTGENIGIYTRKNGLLSDNVIQVFEDREGNVWVAQSGGVSKLRYNFRAFENYSARSLAGEMPVLPSARVNTVHIPSAAQTLSANSQAPASSNQTLSANSQAPTSIRHTPSDGRQVVPATSYIPSAGSQTLTDTRYRPSAPRQTPPAGPDPCYVWAGTEGGLACIHEDGTSLHITQEDGLTGDWVNGLAGDSRGILWIATTQGLNGISFEDDVDVPDAYDFREIQVFGAEATLFSIRESPPFIAAEKLRVYSEETGEFLQSAWFPGLRNLYGVVGSQIYVLSPQEGLPATLYKAVAFDSDGHLWVGTLDRGIYRSTTQVTVEMLDPYRRPGGAAGSGELRFEPFWTSEQEAPVNHIEKLVWVGNTMWVGTQEGLFALDPETAGIVHHITTDDGLPADNTVSFAVSQGTGHFWIGTNRGLAEFDPADRRVIQTITRLNGLVDNEVWLYGSVQVDERGTVYYGTANGLSIYHPQLDGPNEVPPIVQLISADISYQSEGRNEVNFEYAGLSYASVSEVRYRTRLLGYDENWSPETFDIRLRYTNLPAIFWPKEYTFEVMAVNESGVPSEEPYRYAFLVEPVWWLQWWAFLFYLVVFSAGVLVVDRVQRSRLIKKERDAARLREAELKAETALERSIASDARAKALKAENERKMLELEKARELEKAYHELKAAQNQLIQAEKMASLGRLSAGIAHEIKNPMNFINNFAGLSTELVDELMDAIKAGDEDEVEFLLTNLKHNTTKIEEHGKRADSIVRSMMQHARGGKSSFEETDLNLLIEKYTDLAYHGKRAQISDFYTQMTMDLDPDVQKVKLMGQEIGQVLLNIIGNSLDAVWDHKKKIDGEYKPEIRISTRRMPGDVEIRIADNGPGVPEDIREKIFEPFFTTKPTGEGTGLGLSLSYDIITQGHNGSLRLESKEGRGAAFIITLPA